MLSNVTAWARYRVTFGPPVSGDRIQVGEMRLFGETVPTLTIRANTGNVLLSWPNTAGYILERRATLPGTPWAVVSNVPVLSNGTNTVTLPANTSSTFFRLRK